MSGRLLKSSAVMFFGSAVYALCQWAQLSIVARNFDANTLGSYTLALAVTAPIYMFFGFQLRTIQVTDVNREWEIEDFIVFRTCAYIAASSVLIVLLIFALPRENREVFFLVAALKSLEGYSEIFNSKQQLEGRVDIIALSMAMKGGLAVISFYIGVIYLDSLLMALVGAGVCVCMVLALYDTKRIARPVFLGGVLIRRQRLVKMFYLGLPLAIVMLVISLNSNMSKYLAEAILGREAQAIYSTLIYVLAIGGIVISSMGQVFVPRMGRLYSEKRYSKFISVAAVLFMLSLAVGLMSFLVARVYGKEMVTLLFGEGMSVHYELFCQIMAASVLVYSSSALGYVLTSMRAFKVQPYIVGFILLVSLPVTVYALKHYLLSGVVYALALMSFMQALLYSIVIIHFLAKGKRGLVR